MSKLNVLYIGRKTHGLRSGILVSAKMIVDLLGKANCAVHYIDSCDYDSYLNKKYDNVDIIWFYDDTEYSEDNINKLQNLYSDKIPILINSTYNNDNERTKKLIDRIKLLNKHCNNVYLAVFTEEVENNMLFSDVKNNIFAVPKTIKNGVNSVRKYGERQGICLGEYNKFMNSSLTDNLNIYQIVSELKKTFTDINLFAFKHHNFQHDHKLNPYTVDKVNTLDEIKFIENNMTIINYREDLLSWINNFRIYVTLINKESFSMIPAEVQSVGTFVMHRNMPQSLNSYFYYSAYMWESIDDLKNAIKLVYYNEKVWNELSNLSILNYQTNCVNNLRYILRLQLEKLIIRHKRLINNV